MISTVYTFTCMCTLRFFFCLSVSYLCIDVLNQPQIIDWLFIVKKWKPFLTCLGTTWTHTALFLLTLNYKTSTSFPWSSVKITKVVFEVSFVYTKPSSKALLTYFIRVCVWDTYLFLRMCVLGVMDIIRLFWHFKRIKMFHEVEFSWSWLSYSAQA